MLTAARIYATARHAYGVYLCSHTAHYLLVWLRFIARASLTLLLLCLGVCLGLLFTRGSRRFCRCSPLTSRAAYGRVLSLVECLCSVSPP